MRSSSLVVLSLLELVTIHFRCVIGLGGTMLGGAGQEQDATSEIQKIVDTVKAELERKTGVSFPVFAAESYRSQVVAGTNYFVKVFVGGNDYVHLRIYKPLPQANAEPALHGYQLNKSKGDKLEYFEQ